MHKLFIPDLLLDRLVCLIFISVLVTRRLITGVIGAGREVVIIRVGIVRTIPQDISIEANLRFGILHVGAAIIIITTIVAVIRVVEAEISFTG